MMEKDGDTDISAVGVGATDELDDLNDTTKKNVQLGGVGDDLEKDSAGEEDVTQEDDFTET